MRIIAVEAAAVGNVTANVLELEDLSDPKSNTATAGFVPPAEYINAPRTVNVELAHVAQLHLQCNLYRLLHLLLCTQ